MPVTTTYERTVTYLPELLDLVVATGRRRSAVCKLRYRDLKLDAPRPMDLPKGTRWFGEIAWPADSDKQGKAWTTPINKLARAALDRVLDQRPAFNLDGYLFPSPRKPGEPVRGDVTSKWLKQAEKLAKVEKHDGSLWHAYRRLWATERKDLPVQDVARAGGWKDLKTLQTVYQQADTATTYAVVTHRSRERDQKVETR